LPVVLCTAGIDNRKTMEEIRNKVAESGILTLNLEPYIPHEDTIAVFDLKPFLFRELILKEKDYRAALQQYDWNQYAGKHVAIFCSADAIIPVWAYMLAASYVAPVALSAHTGTTTAMINELITQGIQQLDVTDYIDKRVVLKGCGDIAIPEAAYIAATVKLRPVAKSLMYGEPCSTVPIYKKATPPKAEIV